MIEYTQLKIGIVLPFFTLPCKDFKELVTPSWIAMLWKGLNHFSIQICLLQDIMNLSKQQNDYLIMDEAIKSRLSV